MTLTRKLRHLAVRLARWLTAAPSSSKYPDGVVYRV